MIWVPPGGTAGFNWHRSNIQGVQPVTSMGTNNPPGALNVKGAWTTILSALEFDAYAIRIRFNASATGGTAKSLLTDVGTDPAGGVVFSVVIPDLISGPSGTWLLGLVYDYYFPLFIPAGSSVACRSQTNAAAGGANFVVMDVYGRPRDVSQLRVGTRVESYGIVSAGSSRGTIITPGTVAEGAYVTLGTTTLPVWWFQAGFSIIDGSMNGDVYHLDVASGDAPNEQILIEDMACATTGSEQIGQLLSVPQARDLAIGTTIRGRGQVSGVGGDTNTHVAAYGLV